MLTNEKYTSEIVKLIPEKKRCKTEKEWQFQVFFSSFTMNWELIEADKDNVIT